MRRIVDSIEIKRPPQAVFAFLCDIEACLRLNPSYSVLSFDALTHDKMCKGARYRFFLMVDGKRAKYESEVIEFIENKKITSKAIDDRLHLTLTLQVTSQGTLLTHDEQFVLPHEVLYVKPAETNPLRLFHDLWQKAHHLTMGLGFYDRETERRIKEVEEILGNSLRTWLGRIKEKLEAESQVPEG